jgi:hypothetical protein
MIARVSTRVPPGKQTCDQQMRGFVAIVPSEQLDSAHRKVLRGPVTAKGGLLLRCRPHARGVANAGLPAPEGEVLLLVILA